MADLAERLLEICALDKSAKLLEGERENDL